MDNILGVQVIHALSRLPADFYERQQLELGLEDVQMFVQRRALAPLRHDGQFGFADASHEQDNIDVSRFAQNGDLVLESQQLRRCGTLDVQRLDGDGAVPVGLENCPKGAGSDSGPDQDFVGVDFPVLDGFARSQEILGGLVCGPRSWTFWP